MSTFTRLIGSLTASVPTHLQSRCVAAIDGRDLDSAPGPEGEAGTGADHTPEGGVAPVPSPSGPPTCELVVREPLSLFFRDPAVDDYLADLLDQWGAKS